MAAELRRRRPRVSVAGEGRTEVSECQEAPAVILRVHEYGWALAGSLEALNVFR